MTLEEAINYLKEDLLVPGSVPKLEFQDAEQLGIEALKRIEDMRISPCTTADEILPDETEE